MYLLLQKIAANVPPFIQSINKNAHEGCTRNIERYCGQYVIIQYVGR